jgi:hypothetical protein
MSYVLNALVSLAFAGAVGGVIHFWRTHLETARRDEMRALAARRGWALTVTGERLGRAGTLRLAPRGGLPWVAEARPKASRLGGAVTEYEAEAPRWAEGTLILYIAALADTADGASTARESSERALREIMGDEVARDAAMHPVSAQDSVTGFATADPSLRVDLADLRRILADWEPIRSGLHGRPILILSPQGMRLKILLTIRRSDQMERFVDLALELSRVIGP